MSKKSQSQPDASTTYTASAEQVLAACWAFIVERLTKLGAMIGSGTAAKLAAVDVRFGFPSERACSSNTQKLNGETTTAAAMRWQTILPKLDLGKVHADGQRPTILISPVHTSWLDVLTSLTLAALAVLYPPTLEPVFNKKAKDYSPVKSILMRVRHPKDTTRWVAAKLQRFGETFKATAKHLGIEINKELQTSPRATGTLQELHSAFLLDLANTLNPGEPFPSEMDAAARIGTLPNIPYLKVERENIQGWLKKIRSVRNNAKGKPLMIFRLTDVYKAFVTGSEGLRLMLVPSAIVADITTQHPESTVFEYETAADAPAQPAPVDVNNVDASEKVAN